jgi:hypothetical protein
VVDVRVKTKWRAHCDFAYFNESACVSEAGLSYTYSQDEWRDGEEKMYRIGFPFWKQAARLGIPLKLRINVIRDAEANVFVATSDDLTGLVCEAPSMDELIREVDLATDELLALQLPSPPLVRPVTDLRICAA